MTRIQRSDLIACLMGAFGALVFGWHILFRRHRT